jgi:hypothetical protein
MRVWHPFVSVPDGRPALVVFIVLFVLFAFTALQAAGRNLKTEAAPRRAISLELAGTEQRAREVIESWERAGVKDEAYRHLIWDNLFIVFYSTFAAFGCVLAARAFFRGGTTGSAAALFVAWLPWLAGMFEYVENSAMHAMLGGFRGETLPRLGWQCATVKFAMMIPLALYALAGVVAYFVAWRRGTL